MVFDKLIENFKLCSTFLIVCIRAFNISHKCSLWQGLSSATNTFDFGVWFAYWKFEPWLSCEIIALRKKYSWSPVCQLYFFRRTTISQLTLAISFECYILGLWYFTWVFLVILDISWVPKCLTLSPWPWCFTNSLKTLTLATSFVLGLRCLCGYQIFFYLMTSTLLFDLLFETLDFAISFDWYVLKLWCFTLVVSSLQAICPSHSP
jgi:hypothetical protein